MLMPCHGSSPFDSNVYLFHYTGAERQKGNHYLSSDMFGLYIPF
jgi:hypothetical protein